MFEKNTNQKISRQKLLNFAFGKFYEYAGERRADWEQKVLLQSFVSTFLADLVDGCYSLELGFAK